jgi:L-lactate dehydrogenase complex protein LldG
MYTLFKAKAEAVSAEVHRFATKTEMLGFLTSFLQQNGLADAPQHRAVLADCPCLDTRDQDSLRLLAGLTFEVTRDVTATARFGISQMEWALADTGTLVQDSSAIEQRLVSSLPTIHIALVPTCGLTPDLPSLLPSLHPSRSAYISMITGPSRTADIERVLTIGVHGPKRLVILFIDDAKARPS